MLHISLIDVFATHTYVWPGRLTHRALKKPHHSVRGRVKTCPMAHFIPNIDLGCLFRGSTPGGGLSKPSSASYFCLGGRG